MSVKVSPSIMCVDFLHLEKQIKKLEDAGVDYLHFDIMDGTFVPNFTMGPDILKAVRSVTNLPFDVHLMISRPDDYIKEFAQASTMPGKAIDNIISVHIETCPHLKRTLRIIKDCRVKTGVVLNPATPLSSLKGVLNDVSMVVIMCVNPGFAGQKLIPSTIPKIKRLKKMLNEKGLDVKIQADGNVSFVNARKMIKAGADILVAGTSSLFREGMDWREAVRRLRGDS